MKNVFFATRRALDRRRFLRGAGVSLALPMLSAMTPGFARPATADAQTPRRMVAIETNQGNMPQFFFPEKRAADTRPPTVYPKTGTGTLQLVQARDERYYMREPVPVFG